MDTDIIVNICLGVGLAACSGFRVFIPLLISNLAIHFGVVNVSSGFEWLGSWPAFAVLASASVAEVIAYYVPWLDNLLDTIATPLAVAAGTIVSTSFIEINNPVLQWGLGLIMGGGTAGFIQASTSLVRLASTKLTGGIANPVISTVENVAAISGTLLTFWLPMVGFALAVLFVIWLLRKLLRRRKPSP